MKIVIKKEELSQSVQALSRVTSTRSSIQSLAGILFRSTEGGIELRATNLEMSLSLVLAASVEGEGQFVVPGRLLSDIVKSLPNGDVEIKWEAGATGASLKCGGSSFEIMVFSADDFPSMPSSEGETVKLPSAAFVETVGWVEKAASRDDTRPILTSVLVSASGKTLRMVATDSYRLSVKDVELEQPLSGALEANVPATTLQELERLIGTEPGQLEIALIGGQIVFKFGPITVVSRLVDGQFPNYKQLIPEKFESELKLGNSSLSDVVRRVGLMAQKSTPLKLSFEQGAVTVSAQTPDVGSASERVEVPYSGEPLEIGFNPIFLRDGLESANSESIVIKMISSLRPVLIEAAEDNGYQCLIMPVRLSN